MFGDCYVVLIVEYFDLINFLNIFFLLFNEGIDFEIFYVYVGLVVLGLMCYLKVFDVVEVLIGFEIYVSLV